MGTPILIGLIIFAVIGGALWLKKRKAKPVNDSQANTSTPGSSSTTRQPKT